MNWRNCQGIELDPLFVDVGLRRWVKYMRENHVDFEIMKNGQILSKIEMDKYFE